MPPEHSKAHWSLVTLATALAYGLAGWFALRLAIPPSYASPVFPAAGIALAAALGFGGPALWGVGLGSFAVNLLLSADRGQLTLLTVGVAMLIGSGAAGQAALGRWLVRRFVAQPLALTEPSDLVRFYLLGAAVACLTSSTVATTALVAASVVPAPLAASAWWTWWLGDTMGVLVAAPVGLALIGRPSAEWVGRRALVALPMLVASALLVLATAWVIDAHEQRLRTAFERDAWSLADRIESQLRGPQQALLAMHGVFDTHRQIGPGEVARTAHTWLDQPLYLVAIGYSERVRRPDLPAFEARIRAEGPVPDYRVFDRADQSATAPSDEVVAIRYIEPLDGNRPALGVNALSIPAARVAIDAAARSGDIAATAGFRLTQARQDETGVVLYKALYRGEAATAAQRLASFDAVVFVTLRLDALVNEVAESMQGYVRWCLFDTDPSADRPHLAGPIGCEHAVAAPLRYTRGLSLGGRKLELRVNAEPASVLGLADGGGWMFSIIGLLATAVLGALLLTISGRQRRIEAAVDERTTALQRTSEALRDSQERLRNIVDHVPIGVVYADGDGRVHETNPALARILGTPSVGPGIKLLDWIDPRDRELAAKWLTDLRSGRDALIRGRVRLIAQGDRSVSAQLGLSALQEADGSVRRLVGVVEDITEHLQLEASERALKEAESASRAKSEFVGRMSHELRTPLNAMLGFAQLLGHDKVPPLAPHQQRWAGQIQDAGWHLLNMINDTLDLSMIESGTMRLAPRALDPSALLQATLTLVTAAAARRQVELTPPQIAPGVGTVLGDETRVKQILTNLLSNAIKYNVSGGRVDVRVSRAGSDRIKISVRDTGSGLSPSQLDSLFQPFNRLGRESSAIEGTGIGLVISRRLAELMGGTLTVRSSAGQGATFVLQLPAAGPAADEAVTHEAGAHEGDYRRRTVHYVEDNETNVLLMQGMLSQRPQIDLTISRMGLDALPAIRERHPDLILLDMHLPDIDGMDLLHHLKSADETASIPVLVVSADVTRDRIERAMAEGAVGYLAKPLDLAALLATIDEVLAKADTRWG